AVREAVGINEVQNFGKYLVTGSGARGWLDRIMAGRIPKPGRISLTPMLAPSGRLIGDFTVACLDEGRFRLTASYGAQDVHMRWFDAQLTGDVAVENISDRSTGFQIAGPRARDLLAKVTRADVSADAFRFLDVKRLPLGLMQATVQRVSFTGDLGYEIYVDAMEQRALWHLLWEAGQELGLKPFGMRAMMSLRLDKFFGAWLREFSPDYTPFETGMDRFIRWNKDFIGKAAALKERDTGTARKLCAFIVEAGDADVVAYEPIWLDGRVQGFCTSGGFSHYAGKSVALGFVPSDHAKEGQEVEIEILGEMRKARLVTEPLFDADGARMRG
ncbi:MAG: aminomethyltransferase family protein, partial [Nioella sp.]